MNDERSTPNRDDLRKRLSDEQFRVTQESGTERAFTGEYFDHKAIGRYLCVCCGHALFGSDQKYDSGTGWPSFWAPVSDAAVARREDLSHGLVRVEVKCSGCGSHLGHVFADGPEPTGQRYCINSAALQFEEAE